MQRLTRAKAIRAKCIDCCCEQQSEVRKCQIVDCPLWRYRLGREIDAESDGKSGVNINNEQLGDELDIE